ncbi:MAG TPA: spore germination protein GerW family protein [Syntrophomonadaceae bacterium]|nr:spore germination protein GerW family protein [Syntrophomonadaceae bacterium]
MFKENIEALISRLENMAQAKTVVGDPIVSNGKTIIPLLSVRMGLGVGGGEGNAPQQGVGKGDAGGAGLSLSPAALLIIDESGVQVYALNKKGCLDKLTEMIPEVMSKMGKDGSGCCC